MVYSSLWEGEFVACNLQNTFRKALKLKFVQRYIAGTDSLVVSVLFDYVMHLLIVLGSNPGKCKLFLRLENNFKVIN